MSKKKYHLSSYILLYENGSEENVREIYGYTSEQATGYAQMWCKQNGYRFLACDWAVNRAVSP